MRDAKFPALPAAILLILLAWSALFLDLEHSPPGGVSFEGDIVGYSLGLDGQAWQPFDGRPLDGWSNLFPYLGLAVVKATHGNGVAMRYVPAVFALLAATGFFLLLLRLSSAWTAWVMTCLLLSSPFFITYGRRFHPGILVLSSLLLSLASIHQALALRKTWLFVAAGWMLGLGLHAYLPGRLIPFLGAAWGILLLRSGGMERPRPRQFVALALGFLLASWPVIYAALSQPGIFWHRVSAAMPAHEALLGTIQTKVHAAWRYFEAFLIRKDACWYDEGHGASILDPVAGALFILGIVLCFRDLRSRVRWFFLAGTVLGVLPALLSEGFPHPCTRRAILAVPFAFVLAGQGFEKILPWLLVRAGSTRRLFWMLALVALAAHGFTWFRLKNPPNRTITMSMQGYGAFQAGTAMAAHPAAEVWATGDVGASPSAILFFPKKREVHAIADPWKALEKPLGGEQLWLMAPPASAYGDWIRSCFPKASLRRYLGPDAMPAEHIPFWAFMDPYFREDLVAIAHLDGNSLGEARGFWDPEDGQVYHAGDELQGNGLLPLRAWFYSDEAELMVGGLGEAGAWQLQIDGEPGAAGVHALRAKGLHRLALSPDLSRKLPDLKLKAAKAGAIDFFAARQSGLAERRWAARGKTAVVSNVPCLVWSDPHLDAADLPGVVSFKARIRVPAAASYLFELPWPGKGSVWLDGEKAFDQVGDARPELARAIRLDPSQAHVLSAEMQVTGEPAFYWRANRVLSAAVVVSVDQQKADAVPCSWIVE